MRRTLRSAAPIATVQPMATNTVLPNTIVSVRLLRMSASSL
jgi:hypothetical protein